jgi:hypothetical protein
LERQLARRPLLPDTALGSGATNKLVAFVTQTQAVLRST